LAKALGQVHRQGLTHNDIKPANVLVDDSGNRKSVGASDAESETCRAYDESVRLSSQDCSPRVEVDWAQDF
jgi:serine/threonine protein kinase